jgi:serine/threonine protein kinase
MSDTAATTAAATPAAATTTTIDGFELVNCIATGGVSQVWEVREVASGQSFAMKLLLPEAFGNPEQKAQLKREAKLGQTFDHPNLIKVYDLRISKQHAYFTMELFRGVNLKNMLRADLTSVQIRAKKIMECVVQALAHMHEKGWVHKDVKPDNILCTRGSEVRLIDFSLAAKSASALTKAMTRKKSVVIQGTRTYIAPELVRREPATTSADIYSLGITLYEILTGRPPFIMGNPDALLMAHIQTKPEPPSSYNSNVTPEMDRFVAKLLAKKAKDRHANMQEVFAEVRSLQFFKSDMEEHARVAAQNADDTFKDSMGHRLDSRSDAGRTPEERAAAAAIAKEKLRKQEELRKRAVAAKAGKGKSSSAAASAAPQPAPVPMQPGYPMMPGYPMPAPGYPPMPGYPMPQFPVPGMPFPGQFPQPGAGYPQQPGVAPVYPQPGQPLPAVPPARAATQAGQATPSPAPQPSPTQPQPAVPPRRKTPKSRPEDAANIPLMGEDELPDVM